jgi:putative GTP pyrophosphokinase
MEIRDWNLFLLPYEQAVEELKIKFRALRQELKAREEYAPIEFVTGRIKRVSSILQKAKRLNVPMDRLEVGIEDIAGIRIMCQFAEDIQRVTEIIRKRKDMIVVYEKDYITNTKESGYRSYHVIIEYPVQMSFGVKPVLAEIQIRTLAMNFWATIEHSLNYKYKQQLPDALKFRLRKAAEAAYRLDEEMSSIRDEIVSAQQSFEDQSNLVDRILGDIRRLYFGNRVAEALSLQARFDEAFSAGDFAALEQLSREIRGNHAAELADREDE